MKSPAEIAEGLTLLQRSVVLSLNANDFARAANSRCARRMWWGIKGDIRLIEHQHCTDNSWILNDRGEAVRAVLEGEGD